MLDKTKIDTLKASDDLLASLIDNVGPLEDPSLGSNHFRNACKIIVDQQISYKAALAIWNRLDSLVEDWRTETVIELDIDVLKQVGLSSQKANYMKTLADSLHRGDFSFDNLDQMDDTEVTAELIKIKGFGKWSAEMFLIFSLGREDVFSQTDIGLQRALMHMYGLDKESYWNKVDEITSVWSPHRSIASLYLWHWHDSD